MAVLSMSPLSPSWPPSSQECTQVLELQQYVEQLEDEHEKLMSYQHWCSQRLEGLTQQFIVLAQQKETIEQENQELHRKVAQLTAGNKLLEENKKLKIDLKQFQESFCQLNGEMTQVVSEMQKLQQLFKKNDEEKEKLQLELEKKEIEEGKVKFVNQLDRFAYLTSLMVSLTAFAIFGTLSVALLAGGTLILYYQWSKKNVREELENHLRIYSKANPRLSQKMCLRRLYPSFPF